MLFNPVQPHLTFAIYGRLTFDINICDSGTAGIWHLGIGAESNLNPAWHLAFAFSKALTFDIYDFATADIWHLPAAIVEIIGGVAQIILIAPRLCRPAIPHMRSLIQGDASVLRRRHPIDVPAARSCALGERSPPHHSALVMAGLGWLEQGHARSVTIAAAQSSQGSLAESLACRVCFT